MVANNNRSGMTDADLVESFRAGDGEAFTTLYERHRAGVLAYARGLLGGGEAAEEAVQAGFVRALESLPGLRSPEMFRTWLFTIVRNEAYMQLRRPTLERLEEGQVWDGESPADAAVRADDVQRIRLLLERLRPAYREVLLLVTYEEMTYAEIAAVTGTSVSAVESRIFKARRALARALEPYHHDVRRVG